VVVDPQHPRSQDLLPLLPDTTLPARESIEKRLPAPVVPAKPPR